MTKEELNNFINSEEYIEIKINNFDDNTYLVELNQLKVLILKKDLKL